MVKSKFLTAILATGVIGAGFVGYSATTIPAYAEAVRVQNPVQMPGFGDVVDVVSPAVVSVRVSAKVQPASNTQFGRDFQELPEDHPLRRFFREFDDNQFGKRDFRGKGDDRRAERPSRPRPVSQGSGFFISEDGYIVTNNHVVEGGEEFTIVMNDGTELAADLIGTDQRTDLAVLKVQEGAGSNFTYVDFAAEDAVRVGDWVVAVGNPFGLGGTVTAGIVSAFGRDIGSGPYDDFIQIDAAVNRGNSGGPTFNLNGEVVGVNTAIFSPSGGNVGIAFAVPAYVVKQVVGELLEDGVVDRGYLGVSIQPVTAEISESLGLETADGALIADLEETAPAAKAGIQSGDIVVAVEGTAIKTPRELSRVIAGFQPGKSVKIDIIRDGEKKTLDVELGKLPSDTVAKAEPSKPAQEDVAPSDLTALGITVIPAEEGDGVLVTAVSPDGAAAEAGIRPGVVIRSVNNAVVKSAQDVETQLEAVSKLDRSAVLMRLDDGSSSRFVAIPLDQG